MERQPRTIAEIINKILPRSSGDNMPVCWIPMTVKEEIKTVMAIRGNTFRANAPKGNCINLFRRGNREIKAISDNSMLII